MLSYKPDLENTTLFRIKQERAQIRPSECNLGQLMRLWYVSHGKSKSLMLTSPSEQEIFFYFFFFGGGGGGVLSPLLLPYFVYTSSKGSDESVHLHRLA